MRIISGKYRSRIIKTLNGLDVRPTTDRVREAMFSSLISICGSLENISVMDAFAGSGALGFECVSRGATNLVSFENNKKVYENLLSNYQMFKQDESNIKLIFADVKKCNFAIICKGLTFDVVFFDPPYKNNPQDCVEILSKLKNFNMLSNNAIIVYEHSAKSKVEDFKDYFSVENFELVNDKIYGEIAVDFFKFVLE